jgi:hypothetical protein
MTTEELNCGEMCSLLCWRRTIVRERLEQLRETVKRQLNQKKPESGVKSVI